MFLQIVKENLLQRTTFAHADREFYFPGEREKFEKDTASNKVDPFYLENRFNYKCNSSGYRTPEFNTFKDREFGIVFGCSYTEGVGLHEEHVWHGHLARQYGVPIMNLAMGGTGPDTIEWNSMLYTANMHKYPKPKFVIFQWPGFYRKLFTNPNFKTGDSMLATLPSRGVENEVPHKGPHHMATTLDYAWYIERWVAYPELAYNSIFKSVMAANTSFRNIGVKTLNWMWLADYFEEDEDNVLKQHKEQLPISYLETNHIRDYKARDCMHPGRAVHEEVFRQLTPQIERLL